ncbi:MAG: radical SAM protein [Proteobacteria bacterium]|nr:radical SAM protein [Pseudomonadota bacterium]
MDYQGIIIRPPSEADSLILQVTIGCSHNKCTFCPTYKGVSFRLKDEKIIDKDIDFARKRYGQYVRRVFLCDGDVLILKTDYLLNLFKKLKNAFPNLQRIGLYGNAKSVLRKSDEELRLLKENGLGIVYLGVESGNDEVLKNINKGVTSEEILKAGKSVVEAGIKLSVTVLLGIGGVDLSHKHAIDTGKLLSEMEPNYIGALTVMVIEGTPLYNEQKSGKFILPKPFQLLEELKIMIENTDLRTGLFMANHASNYLPLKIRLPKDKIQTLQLLSKIISQKDENHLKPEYYRAL